MELAALSKGTWDEMKWECRAIILGTRLIEEWVSTFTFPLDVYLKMFSFN